jgi:uncharacterized integral membrane protein|tara:strand:- start:862 stop:1104 length:243 start_codon:yes stop_codon:yes gene_type:complete
MENEDIDLQTTPDDEGMSPTLASEEPSTNWTPILIALAFLIVFIFIIMNPMGIQFHKLMYGNSFGISELSYKPGAALMSA